MDWTGDVAAGDWIRARLDAGLSASMHGVVPRGFPAYVRVFHRPSVAELPGRAMPTQDEWQRMADAERQTLAAAIVQSPTTWAETAAAFGTELHALAQWNRIVRTPTDASGWQDVIAPDGREFHAPEEGGLDPDLVAAVAEHLAAHTTTPDDGHVALWSGWGGLVGFYGETPSRTFLTFSDDGADPVQDHHNEMLGRSITDPFNNVFRKPTWQPGILSDEVSRGPLLELPAREHVLFRGGASELADPDWVLNVPWRDRELEEHGFAPDAQSPSLVWPADHAWVLVTEVDFDSTIVGGSPELVRAIVADHRLEALPIRADADLTWDGDRINA